MFYNKFVFIILKRRYNLLILLYGLLFIYCLIFCYLYFSLLCLEMYFEYIKFIKDMKI